MAQWINMYDNRGPADRYGRRSRRLLGLGKILAARTVDDGNGIDHVRTDIVTMQVPGHVTLKEARRIAWATFTTGGNCHHSYDCCGCGSTSPYAHQMRRIRRGQFSFPLVYSRNY